MPRPYEWRSGPGEVGEGVVGGDDGGVGAAEVEGVVGVELVEVGDEGGGDEAVVVDGL